MWETLLDRLVRALVRQGALVVEMPSGRRAECGDGTGPVIRVRISDPTLPRRLVLSPELALGEGYTEGGLEISGDDLHALLGLVLDNGADTLRHWSLAPHRGWRWLARTARQFNPVPRARRNVAHHYDLSQRLYDRFLDADLQYSCAYFRDPAESLEQAQANKKRQIAAKLLLRPGMRVLDIGCGWGGMALSLAREHDVEVVGVTLSRDQHRMALRRAEAEGLSDRVDFRLTDYREVSETFDRVVSVGMFEHVGVPHYTTFFDTVRGRLQPDGVALIHTIGRMRPPGSTSPWIDRYIFPGGYVPALSEVMTAVERAGLWSCDIEVLRNHYAETLRHWQKRFAQRIHELPDLDTPEFRRMWRYYLVASEMSFRRGGLAVFQVQLARRQDAVPLTRDYLYPAAAVSERDVAA